MAHSHTVTFLSHFRRPAYRLSSSCLSLTIRTTYLLSHLPFNPTSPHSTSVLPSYPLFLLPSFLLFSHLASALSTLNSSRRAVTPCALPCSRTNAQIPLRFLFLSRPPYFLYSFPFLVPSFPLSLFLRRWAMHACTHAPRRPPTVDRRLRGATSCLPACLPASARPSRFTLSSSLPLFFQLNQLQHISYRNNFIPPRP